MFTNLGVENGRLRSQYCRLLVRQRVRYVHRFFVRWQSQERREVPEVWLSATQLIGVSKRGVGARQ